MINSLQNLYNVMSIQTASYDSVYMERFIRRRIKKLGLTYDADAYGNIYVTKGDADIYPTMVCHIDTVHNVNPDVKVFKTDNKMFAMDTHTMTQYGIGGDDKVGVYITLQLLEKFENFKAAFFKDEEVGCVGSGQADFNFFDDSSFVLQCDRKGNTDFVNSISMVQLYDDKIQKVIKPLLEHYKRTETTGGLTDVLSIAENNNVQVANMSCGYYNPHMDDEYIDIDHVFETSILCYQILSATKFKRFEMQRTKRVYNNYAWGNYNHNSYKPKAQYVPQKYTPIDQYEQEINYNKQVEKIHEKYCTSCGCDTIYDDWEGAYYCANCNGYSMYYEADTLTNNYENEIHKYNADDFS